MDEATIRELWEKYPCGDVLVGRLDDKYAGNYRRFFDEYCERKHAAKPVDRSKIPGAIGLDKNLRIRIGAKAMAKGRAPDGVQRSCRFHH